MINDEYLLDLCRRISPGPWSWGKDWETIHLDDESGQYSDKYADLQLHDGNNKAILPLVVDHYELMIDTADILKTPTSDDREFITLARIIVPQLIERAQKAESQLGEILHEAK